MVIYYIEHVYLNALHLFVMPYFPGPTFIPCPTSIPEARVHKYLLIHVNKTFWREVHIIIVLFHIDSQNYANFSHITYMYIDCDRWHFINIKNPGLFFVFIFTSIIFLMAMPNSTQDCSPDWPGPKFFFYKIALEGKTLNFRVVQNKPCNIFFIFDN